MGFFSWFPKKMSFVKEKLTSIKSFFKKIFTRIWKKKWWTIPSIIVILVAIVLIFKKTWKQPQNEIFVSNDHVVALWSVQNVISLMWSTQFANAQKLTFANKWKVTSIKVNIWDEVKKWDVLATISTDTLDAEVEKMKKNIKNQELKLKKAWWYDKELDILKAQYAYDTLVVQQQTQPKEQNLDLTNKEFELQEMEKQIKERQEKLDQMQTEYNKLVSWWEKTENLIALYSGELKNRNMELKSIIRWFADDAKSLQLLLDWYDRIIGMTEAYSIATPYIQIDDESALSKSKKQFWIVKDCLTTLENLNKQFGDKSLDEISKDEIKSGAIVYKLLWDTFIERWKINYDMFMDNSDAFSRADTENSTTYGTQYQSRWYKYQDQYSSIIDKLDNIKDLDSLQWESSDLLKRYVMDLVKLQNDYEKAKLELDTFKQKSELDKLELNNKIKNALQDLSDAKNWVSQNEELELLKNDLDSLKVDLETLMKRYDEYKIIANFDWIVTKINMQIWDNIDSSSSQEQQYIYVETPNLLEVNLSVDQIDIVKISVWLPVEIYLDAFPNSVYTGTFYEVDTMPDGGGEYWWSYKAKVRFQKNNSEERILWWMNANVRIIVDEVNDAIVVPNPAIVENENFEKIVRLQTSNGNWIDQVIETWPSDDINTVVTSWLKEWDVIKWLYITDDSMSRMGLGQENNGDDDFYMWY